MVAGRSRDGSGVVAITHVPSPALERGERTHVGRERIDMNLAEEQHRGYRQMLDEAGAEVLMLDVNREMPDSVFLEDTAIVLDEIAIITPMGVESRRGEPAGIAPVLARFRELRRVELPATIEGGDVLRVGRTILVGRSGRTNAAGVAALTALGRELGYEVRDVSMRDALHLKSACTALPDGKLLVNRAWVDVESLAGFELVEVPEGDPWGANVALVGEVVCAAAEHELTNQVLVERGYDVRSVPLSEFAKAEGAVTCMSLLMPKNPPSAGVIARA